MRGALPSQTVNLSAGLRCNTIHGRRQVILIPELVCFAGIAVGSSSCSILISARSQGAGCEQNSPKRQTDMESSHFNGC